MRAHLVTCGVLAATLLFVPSVAYAAPADRLPAAKKAVIDDLLRPRIRTREANGVALVYQGGKEIYRRHIGMADWENRVPISSDTVFRVASVTKTFTAAAILELAADNKLQLSDSLSKFLPGFPQGEKITITHLLAHSSGLGGVPQPADPVREQTIDEVVAAIAATPLAFEPGSSERYSGAGYALLAKVIEVVSGTTYDDYLRTSFFVPLGMSRFGNFELREIVPGRSRGYLPAAGAVGVANVPLDALSTFIGEGSLQMTADDLMRWAEAVRTRRFGNINGPGYPYGWGVRRDRGTKRIEQTGLHGGFTSAVVIYPTEQLSVVCAFNTQSGYFNFCGRQMAEAVLGMPGQSVPSLAGRPMTIGRSEAAPLEGVYRARPNLAMRVEWRSGGLHFRWVNESVWQYLIRRSDGSFYAPSETAVLTFHKPATGQPASSVSWQSSFDTLSFAREN